MTDPRQLSSREIERQYRVLRQTLGMHATLRDRYRVMAKTAKGILIVVAVIFCATTFGGEHICSALGIPAEVGQFVLGSASIMAFAASLVLILVDWEGRSALHEKAADAWVRALKTFRRRRLDDGTWPQNYWQELDEAYWRADEVSVPIPDRAFNALKAKYLKKLAVSELVSRYPGCPRLVLSIIVKVRDTKRAIVSDGERGGEDDGQRAATPKVGPDAKTSR